MQGMFEGGFQGEKRHLLPLLSKPRPTCGFGFKLVELPRDWEQLADGDWAIVHFKSEDSGNIGYCEGPHVR